MAIACVRAKLQGKSRRFSPTSRTIRSYPPPANCEFAECSFYEKAVCSTACSNVHRAPVDAQGRYHHPIVLIFNASLGTSDKKAFRHDKLLSPSRAATFDIWHFPAVSVFGVTCVWLDKMYLYRNILMWPYRIHKTAVWQKPTKLKP